VTYMAHKHNCKRAVSAEHFLAIVEEMWLRGGNATDAIERMIKETGSTIKAAHMRSSGSDVMGPKKSSADIIKSTLSRVSPRTRYTMNGMSYFLMTVWHIVTNAYYADVSFVWIVSALWSFSYFLQVMSCPSGFRSWYSVIFAFLLAVSHLVNVARAIDGRHPPPDMNALVVVCNFINLGSYAVVTEFFGPSIMVLQQMIKDIQRLMCLCALILLSFYFSLRTLYEGAADGTNLPVGFTDPFSTFMNLMISAVAIEWPGAAEDPWEVTPSAPRRLKPSSVNLLLSEALGMTELDGLVYFGFILHCFIVFTTSILLLNLLIAMMASSYARVEQEADLERKRIFCRTVFVARRMAVLPMPFSLPLDLVGALYFGSGGQDSEVLTRHSHPNHQHEVLQVLSFWESKKSEERLKSVVTVELMERVLTKSDVMLERMHHLYETTVDHLTEAKTAMNSGKTRAQPRTFEDREMDDQKHTSRM